MKPKAIIFGCGYRGQRYFAKLNLDFDVVAFADNNSALWGSELLGRPVLSPQEIKDYDDVIVFICVQSGFPEIARQLEAMDIPYAINDSGLCYTYQDMVLHPVSFSTVAPYKKSGEEFAVLYVQDAPCERTDKISSVLKAKGVMTQNAFFLAPSIMPESYCKENVFYTFDALLEFVNASEFDLVHCSNEPDILANLMLHSNKPVVVDTHDLLTARSVTSSLETYYLEYAANKFAAGNLYVGAYYRDLQVQRYGISPDQTFTVPNLVVERQIPDADRCQPKLSAADGELHLVYEGGISDQSTSHRFFEEIWNAIISARVHIHYYSQQKIDYCKRLEKTSPYLHYEGNMTGKKLMEEMSKYDVGSLLLNPIDKNALMAYPNKLYEYLASGLPVVTNLTVPLEFVQSQSVGGALDLSGDISEQLKKIAEIKIPDRYLQENKLTMDSMAEDILSFYKKILEIDRMKVK